MIGSLNINICDNNNSPLCVMLSIQCFLHSVNYTVAGCLVQYVCL